MLTLFRTRRAAAAVLVTVAALTLAACGDGDDATSASSTSSTSNPPIDALPTATQPTPTRPSLRTETIDIAGGTVTGGARKIEAKTGEVLRLIVRSDVADHAHLHGYDLLADVAPGRDGVIDVTANIPGVFEIELEDAGLPIGELEVR